MASYIASKHRQKNSERIVSWLTFNELLESTEDEYVVNQCIANFAVILGGSKALLFFISQAANNAQLQSMLSILKQKTLESHNEKNNNKSDDEDCEATPTAPEQRHFADIIPDPIVGHICSYLSKSDVYQFKVSSRQIAIQCLKHQQLVPIRAFDTQQLLNTTRPLSDYYPFVSCSTLSLYHPKCKRNSVFREDQLVCVNYSATNVYDTSFWKPIANTSLPVNTLYQDVRPRTYSRLRTMVTFRLVSKSAVLVMDNKIRAFNADIDLASNTNYKLLIVEYFDIFTTNTCIGAFILYSGQIKVSNIVDYLENTFVYLQGMDNKWHTVLAEQMKNMNYYSNQDKLVCYQHWLSRYKNEMTVCGGHITGGHITLQLNANHPSLCSHPFRIDNVFLNAKQVCMDRLTQFVKYDVVVVTDEQCPHPFVDWDMMKKLKTEFVYRRKGTRTIRQFVDAVLGSNVRCIVGTYSKGTYSKGYRYNEWKFYKMDDTFAYGCCVTFYIFKIQAIPCHGIANKNKVKITFMEGKVYFNTSTSKNEVGKMEYCGIPLIAWVERNDSFQNIIERYMSAKAIECIHKVYRVRPNERPSFIARSKWIHRLCDNYDQGDVLVIKFNKDVGWKNDIVHLPRWVQESSFL
eukprot:99749_1